MVPVLSVIGRKGSRKKELMEFLLQSFRGKGFRIGVIKRLAKEDAEIDEPGKDTYRYRAQGAETVILAGRKRWALFSDSEEEKTLEDFLSLMDGCDLVLLEGYYEKMIPKIEVYRSEVGEPPLARHVAGVMAIYTDVPLPLEVPQFSFDEVELLVNQIESGLLKRGANLCR